MNSLLSKTIHFTVASSYKVFFYSGLTFVAANLSAGELDYSTGSRHLRVNEEFIPVGEQERFAEFAEQFHAIHKRQQEANEDNLGESSVVWRGMHAKGHACMQGHLKVTAFLPSLQKGIFQDGELYPVVARFSNGSGKFQSDHDDDLRGLALKVNRVEGDLLTSLSPRGEQDFLFTNGESHHARDIEQLMKFIHVMAGGNTLDIAKFFLTNRTLALTLLSQTKLRGPIESLATETYWSRAAFRHGPNQAAKYLIEPCQGVPTSQPDGSNPDYLSRDLTRRLVNDGLCFKLKVQIQQDPREQPIEDHQKAWNVDSVEIAKVTFPPQGVMDDASCQALTFNPWNGIEDHRPLGNFNRARKYIYMRAAEYRQSR